MGAFISYDDIIASKKDKINYYKTASVTAVAGQLQAIFAAAGSPSAGSFAVGNTANGIVPVDNVTGVPNIPAFTGTSVGYITRAMFNNTVPGNIYVMDRLFSVGSITMTTATVTTTLASQPSFAGRVPGPDYGDLEIWLESGATALSNHAHTVAINYLDQDGNAGNTGNVSTQNLITGRMFRFPLAAGDSGVSQIVSIVANGVASATGNFNIHIMRPLLNERINIANDLKIQGPDKTMLPEIYADSSLYVVCQPDSTATGLPYVELVVGTKPD